MSSEIEIEFKNIVTEEEFVKLKDSFNIQEHDFITQENHYFDTPTFSLKELGCALRIRHKNGQYELTLKQPAQIGLLETNDILKENQANNMLGNGIIPDGDVKSKLQQLNICLENLQYFGCLTTKRAERKFLNGLLVFDNSFYLNSTDYEIEYEVYDYEKGKKDFLTLMNKFNIPIRKTDNKIKRFYNKKRDMGSDPMFQQS